MHTCMLSHLVLNYVRLFATPWTIARQAPLSMRFSRQEYWSGFPFPHGRRPQFDSWVGNIRWRRDRLPTPVFLDFPCGSTGKESACSAGDPGLIPGSGRSPREGIGYPLQYSWTSLVAQMVKNLSAMWETCVRSLG